MIGNIVKKLLFKKADKKQEQEQKNSLAISLREKSQELSNELSGRIDLMKNEFFVMKEKYNNLLETNYNLGLKHIENGRLSDAIFRFHFIKKFWPQHYDSYYQLAYCLVLNKKPDEAKKILEELMTKDPQHPYGKELLQILNADISSYQNFTTQDS